MIARELARCDSSNADIAVGGQGLIYHPLTELSSSLLGALAETLLGFVTIHSARKSSVVRSQIGIESGC
jgi:hypothetical protein